MIFALSGFAGVGKDEAAKHFAATRVALADPLKRTAQGVYGFSFESLWGPSEMRNVPDERYPRPKHEWRAKGKILVCACCLAEFSDDFDEPPGTANADMHVGQCYLTPRYALILLGTEWGRHCYPHTWVDLAVRTAKHVVDNRLGYHQCHGAIPRTQGDPTVEHVVIPDVRFKNEIERLRHHGAKLIRIKRPGFEKPAFDHPSETEQVQIPDSEFDAIIVNDGSVEELARKVEEIQS